MWEMRILSFTQGYTEVGPLMRLSAAQTGFAFKNSKLEKYSAAGVLLGRWKPYSSTVSTNLTRTSEFY